MTRTLDLKGVIPPMIAPLAADGTVDEASVNRLVEHLYASGCSGVFVFGSSGEGPWLSADQQRALLRHTVKAAGGLFPVLAGALEPGIERTLEALRTIEDEGADAVVLTSPYYFAADDAVQLDYFGRVASVSQLPIVLYNIPPMTHNPISVDTVRQALQFDKVIALKDSAGDLETFKAFLQLREEAPHFRIFQGAQHISAASMLAGADGLVPGLGNIAPGWFVQLYDAAQAGRVAEVEDLQAQINQLWHLHGHDYWLVCLKYAASLLGFGSGATCGYPSRLSDEGRQAIQKLVAAVATVGE